MYFPNEMYSATMIYINLNKFYSIQDMLLSSSSSIVILLIHMKSQKFRTMKILDSWIIRKYFWFHIFLTVFVWNSAFCPNFLSKIFGFMGMGRAIPARIFTIANMTPKNFYCENLVKDEQIGTIQTTNFL